MIDYDSFSRCHLTAFHAGAKELIRVAALRDAKSNNCKFRNLQIKSL